MNSLSIEDDGFFIQPNSSNLEGLFGPINFNKSESSHLTYVAPKQPRSAQKPKLPKPSIKTTVVFAKVVHVYKSADDSYQIIGKYGFALISDTIKLVEILLYKDKQNILTRATINNTQIYLEDNYISFNDNNNEKWYVQFDEENYLKEFLEELRKANVKVTEVVKDKEVDIEGTNNNIEISDNESEKSNISQTRTDILSRMAKMGQSVLPGNIKNDTNDIENTYISSPKNIRKFSADSKAIDNPKEINHTLLDENKRNNNVYMKSPESPLIINSSITPFYPHMQGYPQNAAVVNSIIPSQEFNLLVSENRIQNSEVRMNLTALSSKLDIVLSEISKIKEPPNTDKLENEFLKSKVIDLEKQINDLTEKLSETNQNNSKFDLLIIDKNKEIETEKSKFLELQSTLRNMEDLETKIENLKLRESELNTVISNLELQLEQSKENDIKYLKLQEIHKAILKDHEYLNDKLKSLTDKKETNEKSSKVKLEHEVKYLSNILKESMNLMYQNIMSQHEKLNDPLNPNQFKAVLSTNIKQATFNVIENFQSFLEATDNSIDSANDKASV